MGVTEDHAGAWGGLDWFINYLIDRINRVVNFLTVLDAHYMGLGLLLMLIFLVLRLLLMYLMILL